MVMGMVMGTAMQRRRRKRRNERKGARRNHRWITLPIDTLEVFMRTLVQKINSHPVSAKAFEWGKLISITGAAQIIVQLTGLISGIIVIRLLPTQEYALYTLAN